MEPGQEQRKPNIPPYPPQYRQKKSNWWIPLLIIGVILFGIIAIIGAAVSSVGGAFSGAFEDEPVKVNDVSVLELDLSQMQEYVKDNPFAALSGGTNQASLLNTLSAIERAKDDDKIKGIYFRAGAGNLGFVKANEIRDALIDFKKSGKFIYAFIEMGNELTYFNTLVADSIFMPLEGMLELNGFGSQAMFFDGFFEKIGVDYMVLGHEDFKSAGEMFSRKSYSDSARHQTQVILSQRYDELLAAISKSRGMNLAEIDAAFDKGIYTANDALNQGFIDALAMESDVKEFVKARAFGKKYEKDAVELKTDEKDGNKDEEIEELNLISPAKYLRGSNLEEREVYDEDLQIAIINGVGAISSGKGEGSPFDDSYSIKSGDIVEYLKEAREDDKIKAIILRIDSPGGSVIASEEMWEEIRKTRKVKPVYASMSDVAASGGYYMAMACDTIIAHPTTITGSIGVILAIPNFAGTLDKLGITTDTISTNPSSQFMNVMQPFDENTKSTLWDISTDIYTRFVSKVAESRGKSFDETRALAKGRVWTGEDAKERGLVDVLGGIEDALKIAKRRIGVPEDELVYVQTFPKKKDELQVLLEMFGLEDATMESKLQKFKSSLGLTPEQIFLNWNAMPESMKQQINYMLELSAIASEEKAIMAIPYSIQIQ